jgi:hypothetical protein
MEKNNKKKEEYQVNGHEMVKKIKELIAEGNIRRIIIKNEKGEAFIEIPLTLAVVGTALIPVWAAVGALAALISNCTIEVERK